jgi:hypothetical protein
MSPDIWLVEGDGPPRSTADIVHGWPNDSFQPRIGRAHSIYAHVWNLGPAPIAGVRVEFSTANTSQTIDRTHAHTLGVAFTTLGSRGSRESHRLVKCPVSWTPPPRNQDLLFLIVRVSCLGDAAAADSWSPTDRHVAAHDVRAV